MARLASKGQNGGEECPICRSWSPKLKKLVPCGHHLCTACVSKIEQFAVGSRIAQRCPFCRQDFTILHSPVGLVEVLCARLVWRLPKPAGLERLPASVRVKLLSHLKNGRLLYGDTLIALLRGLSLETLRLSDATNMTNLDLQRLAPLLAGPPKGVVLSNVPMLEDEGLHAILQVAAPILEHLNINSASDKLTGSSLQDFAESLPCLSSLDISHCHGLQPTMLCAIARGCASTLQVLDVSGCRRLDSEAILSLASCRELQRLKLCGLWKLETHPVICVLENCVQLRSLDVTHCGRLNGAELLQAVAAYCIELRELIAGSLPDVDDEVVVALAMSTAGAGLENWSVAGSEITNQSLKIISKHCPVLRRLDLGGCHEITENCVLDTVMEMKQLRVCQTKYCRQLSTATQLFVAQLLGGRALGVEQPSKAHGQATMAANSSGVSCSSTCLSDECSSTAISPSPSSASSGSSGALSSPSASSSSAPASSSCANSSCAAAKPESSRPSTPAMPLGSMQELPDEVSDVAGCFAQATLSTSGPISEDAIRFSCAIAEPADPLLEVSSSRPVEQTATSLSTDLRDADVSSGYVPLTTDSSLQPSMQTSSRGFLLQSSVPAKAKSFRSNASDLRTSSDMPARPKRSALFTSAGASSASATRLPGASPSNSLSQLPVPKAMREAVQSRSSPSRSSGSSSLLNAGATVGGQNGKAAAQVRSSGVVGKTGK